MNKLVLLLLALGLGVSCTSYKAKKLLMPKLQKLCQ